MSGSARPRAVKLATQAEIDAFSKEMGEFVESLKELKKSISAEEKGEFTFPAEIEKMMVDFELKLAEKKAGKLPPPQETFENVQQGITVIRTLKQFAIAATNYKPKVQRGLWVAPDAKFEGAAENTIDMMKQLTKKQLDDALADQKKAVVEKKDAVLSMDSALYSIAGVNIAVPTPEENKKMDRIAALKAGIHPACLFYIPPGTSLHAIVADEQNPQAAIHPAAFVARKV